jgi:transposase
MQASTLLPDVTEVALESIRSDRSMIRLLVHVARPEAACPLCSQSSTRVHSRYERKLADLPWYGVPVQVILHTRRFFCRTAGCSQRVFTERLPHTVSPYARRTKRLSQAMEWFTLALGGEAGARLARRVGVLTSGDTLIRQLRHRSLVTSTTPRMLGIDDWAWRKGQRYGTILCDLERHKVIDLLPDRSVDSVKAWLDSHPGIEIVSRDRASAYAEAARGSAPEAIQVADRWHLLRNLSEALHRILQSKHAVLSQAAKAVGERNKTPVQIEPPSPAAPTRLEKRRQASRSRRLARYDSVMELVRQGISQSEISRTLGIDRRTVRRWTRAGLFPERARVSRRSSLDHFADYLRQRYIEDGCHNASNLWRELREHGFRGSSSIVRQWIHRLRNGPGKHIAPRPVANPKITGTPRQTVWLILQQPAEACDYLEELSRRCPEIEACAAVAREFSHMIRQRDASAWPNWLRSAKNTALKSFVSSLCRDEAAVLAALQLPWSNGQVEGQVHRLKLIKRQMYGRAKFDLLRLRVMFAA